MTKASASKPSGDSEEKRTDKIANGRGLSNRWFWILAIGTIAFVQWPALKELYYNLSGAEFPAQTIPWQHDLDSAMKTANDENRPVLAVFGASWCPPCRAMKREVWPDEQISAAVEAGFVPLYVDVDDPTQSELVSQYRVGSIPAVLILDSDGNVVKKRNAMSVSATLAFLTSETDPS